MKKLSLEEALQLEVGTRIVVEVLEDGSEGVRFGAIVKINESNIGKKRDVNIDDVIVAYDDCKGYDVIKCVYEQWGNKNEPYADIYLLEEGDLKYEK